METSTGETNNIELLFERLRDASLSPVDLMHFFYFHQLRITPCIKSTGESKTNAPYTCHTPLESYDSQLSEYVWHQLLFSNALGRIANLVTFFKAKL